MNNTEKMIAVLKYDMNCSHKWRNRRERRSVEDSEYCMESRTDRPETEVITSRSRNDAQPKKGCGVNGHVSMASNKRVRPFPPSPPHVSSFLISLFLLLVSVLLPLAILHPSCVRVRVFRCLVFPPLVLPPSFLSFFFLSSLFALLSLFARHKRLCSGKTDARSGHAPQEMAPTPRFSRTKRPGGKKWRTKQKTTRNP